MRIFESRKHVICRAAATLVVVCLWHHAVFAQTPEEQYRRASDALYSLDFSIAESSFERLTGQHPANPDYWNALASTILLKIIHDQEKLNVESFAGDRLGTRDSKETIDPELERRLRLNVNIAMTKANAMLRTNPNDIQALYALGVSNGTLASFEGTAKKSYFAAFGKAKEAKKYHERVLKIAPNFTDALVTIGSYEYVASQVPWYVRILIGLWGGDKTGGIRDLEVVAAKGRRASVEAKNILLFVYNREKQYDKALRLTQELHARYPRNFMYELGAASFYKKMGQIDRAIGAYQQVMAKIQSRRDGYDRLRPERVYFEIGMANLGLDSERAIASFSRVAGGETATINEKADSHLWMGKIYDSTNERSKALVQYGAVLALDCDDDLRREAQRYQRRPFSN